MSKLKLELRGHKQLARQLKRLGSKTTAKKILRAAASKATTPLKQAVEAETPEDTGALKRAIIRVIKQRGYFVDARVGADKEAVGEDGRVPSNILHLVEFGTEHSPADAPLRRGYDASEGQMRRTYEAELQSGIEAAAG